MDKLFLVYDKREESEASETRESDEVIDDKAKKCNRA